MLPALQNLYFSLFWTNSRVVLKFVAADAIRQASAFKAQEILVGSDSNPNLIKSFLLIFEVVELHPKKLLSNSPNILEIFGTV